MRTFSCYKLRSSRTSQWSKKQSISNILIQHKVRFLFYFSLLFVSWWLLQVINLKKSEFDPNIPLLFLSPPNILPSSLLQENHNEQGLPLRKQHSDWNKFLALFSNLSSHLSLKWRLVFCPLEMNLWKCNS